MIGKRRPGRCGGPNGGGPYHRVARRLRGIFRSPQGQQGWARIHSHPMPPPARRFRREALLLALLLLLFQVAFSFLSAQHGLRFFAVGEPVATLGTLVDGAGPALTVAAAGAEPTSARLGPVELEAERFYLVTVRASAGLPFELQSGEVGERVPDLKRRIPRRVEAQTSTFPIAPRSHASSRWLEIWNPRPLDLEVVDLEVRELHRGHRWARAALRPLAVALQFPFKR